jgi:tripartite-type tricarboxylate transporter receptor subunit TctC
MKFHRRTFLRLAAGAAVLPVLPRLARAQSYPSRPVRLIVGFAGGGGADIAARLMAQSLSEQLGQPFIVENRTGAGSNIAAEVVSNASADGYTLLLATTGNAVNATLYKKLHFDFVRDIAPVAGISREPHVVVVNPSFPAKTVSDFIAYARANPNTVNMGSGGNGGPAHMAGELFEMMAGVNLVHVPYRGISPALTDLLGGQVQVVFSSMPSSIGYIKSGRLRALAVTAATRLAAMPDVPAVAESVPGYEVSTWYGIGAPKNTPAEVVDKLNTEISAALAGLKFKARLADLGAVAMAGSPGEFGKFISNEIEKWGKVVRAAHIMAG